MNLKLNFNDINSLEYQQIINATINHITSRMTLPAGELSISFINKQEMQKINKQYRNKDIATDVLTFPIFDDEIIGDIYLCIDEIHKKAEEHTIDKNEQLTMTLAHAFAHLEGYDHENEEKRTVMEDYEDFLLKYYDAY